MRILVIKMSSLGDVVHALPAVTDASSVGINVDWVVEETFADIPATHPGVARVIPIAWRRWRKHLRKSALEMRNFYAELRRQNYDLVIDSQGLIKSAAVALLARGPRRGFSHTSAREPWAAFAYGNSFRIDINQHAIDRQRQLFAAALGYQLQGPAVSGLESHSRRSKQVVLLHGTTWDSKHWPVAMWQALAQQIRADGYEPVVTWGDAIEQIRASKIAEASGATLQDRVSIGELGLQLAQAAAVIGVDSGLCHYGAALGTPTLGLYGPTDGQLTGCRGQNAGLLQAATPCSPCLRKTCRNFRGDIPIWQDQPVNPPCFADLPPDVVWRKTQMLMATD